MTNVSTPEKIRLRRTLVDFCLRALEQEGWKIRKVSGHNGARIRRITRSGDSRLAAIRTTQDSWIAFPRTKDGSTWATLAVVDVVVVASVDPDDRTFARIHMIDAEEMRNRFDRAYAARLGAGHTIPVGRGVWVALYENEVSDPVTLVGAGAGIANEPIARMSLDSGTQTAAAMQQQSPASTPLGPRDPVEASAAAAMQPASASDAGEEPLTIAEAKTRLARTLGVDPSNIRITIEA